MLDYGRPNLMHKNERIFLLNLIIHKMYKIVYFMLRKNYSPAGNWTPVSHVTGGDTNHYTTEDYVSYISFFLFILYITA